MPSAIKTTNIGLNQWTQNENPKRQDFVDDNKKIDDAIGLIKADILAIDIAAEKTTLKDTGNNYTSTNVEGALTEVATNINKNKADIATNKANITALQTKTDTTNTNLESIKLEVLGSKSNLIQATSKLNKLL